MKLSHINLRRQLTLVSLLLLTLPWAGCQFVREIESTLRQGQAQALEATAQAVAASLGEQRQLLYPWPERINQPGNGNRSLYAAVAEGPILVDGYADGWSEQWTGRFESNSGSSALAVNYQALTRHDQLYLLLSVEDAEVVYDNPGLSPEPNGDRLLLRTWPDGRRQDYVIATAAPGQVRGSYIDRRLPGTDAQRIQGFWQDNANGYTLELELPLNITGGRLGLEVIDVPHSTNRNPLTTGNINAVDTQAPPWLIFSPTGLEQALSVFNGPGQQLQVFDAGAQRIAHSSVSTRQPPSHSRKVKRDEPSTFWLLRLFYRRILSDSSLNELPEVTVDGQLSAPELEQALRNITTTTWYNHPQGRRTILSSATPIYSEGKVVGAVVARQGSEEYLSLTDRAFSRLFAYSLLAIGAATLGLLAYASILSWRIGRLSRAASQVVQNGEIVIDNFPRSRANDEVGELSRRYADLLAELKGYNEYLRTLSRKLSHELRTPIAVIQSSLDNLQADLPNTESATYLSRAREGLSRLQRILTAMTEASRVEESVRGNPLAPMNLVPLLHELLPAYQGAYPEFRLELHCDADSAWVQASPDLLVQALDKLVDNAASFSAKGKSLSLQLATIDDDWQVAVINQGPPLPLAMQGQLFEAMVSVREKQGSDSVHLGLGLYIVKIISDYLGARARAENLPNGGGVAVSLSLPHLVSDLE
ncbi:MAG: ATP-binding protein [Parahaliea sp.]